LQAGWKGKYKDADANDTNERRLNWSAFMRTKTPTHFLALNWCPSLWLECIYNPWYCLTATNLPKCRRKVLTASWLLNWHPVRGINKAARTALTRDGLAIYAKCRSGNRTTNYQIWHLLAEKSNERHTPRLGQEMRHKVAVNGFQWGFGEMDA